MLRAANLAVRFLLELAALVAAGYWGWTTFDGFVFRLLACIGLPIALAALWGVFRVPNDGGPPVVQIPGWLRLILEAFVFGLATVLLANAEHPGLAFAFLVIVLINYAIDWRRVVSLMER